MTIAIGDLQGCCQPLRSLLERAAPAEQEPIWFCGDLVNRGPQSLQAIETVMAMGDRAQSVLGNHDLHLLAVAAGARRTKRGDTIDEILRSSRRTEIIQWVRTRPLAVLRGDYLMVHAGVLPEWDAQKVVALAQEVEAVLQGPDWGDFMATMYGNDPERWDDGLSGDDRLRVIVNALTRMRFLRQDGSMDLASKGAPDQWLAAAKGQASKGQASKGTSSKSGASKGGGKSELAPLVPWFDWPQRKTATKTLVFGHWSTLGLQMRPNLVALDSGCVWGGRLSAVRLETRELFQVKCNAALEPGEE